jgi:hypothetical protein
LTKENLVSEEPDSDDTVAASILILLLPLRVSGGSGNSSVSLNGSKVISGGRRLSREKLKGVGFDETPDAPPLGKGLVEMGLALAAWKSGIDQAEARGGV